LSGLDHEKRRERLQNNAYFCFFWFFFARFDYFDFLRRPEKIVQTCSSLEASAFSTETLERSLSLRNVGEPTIFDYKFLTTTFRKKTVSSTKYFD
jgi:hypothetical protein